MFAILLNWNKRLRGAHESALYLCVLTLFVWFLLLFLASISPSPKYTIWYSSFPLLSSFGLFFVPLSSLGSLISSFFSEAWLVTLTKVFNQQISCTYTFLFGVWQRTSTCVSFPGSIPLLMIRRSFLIGSISLLTVKTGPHFCVFIEILHHSLETWIHPSASVRSSYELPIPSPFWLVSQSLKLSSYFVF
jgi:hypothetical protein